MLRKAGFLLLVLLSASAMAEDRPRGTVTELAVHDGKYKRQRRVWVYLPPGYDKESKTPYRLLVLFDGLTYTTEVPAAAILDDLLAAHAIPPTVGILIDKSDSRLADLANHQAFADFVAEELVPWARAKWRIDANPRVTIVGGYSAGGLAAAYVAFKYPNVFGKVLSQSGAFWRGNEGGSESVEWLTEQFRRAPKLPLVFYLEVGALETGKTAAGPVFIETNRRLRDVLAAKGYAYRYVEVPGAAHEPTHWRAQLPEALKYLSSRE